VLQTFNIFLRCRNVEQVVGMHLDLDECYQLFQ